MGVGVSPSIPARQGSGLCVRIPRAATQRSNMSEYTRFDAADLHRLAQVILTGCGMTAEDADIGAGVLLYADLRGIDSHGVAHLSAHQSYVRGLKNGNVNPRPALRTVNETPTTALLDGDGGLGPVVAHRAMEKAIAKARESGVGMVGVANSRHFGSAGYYSEMALEHDMIGIAMTQASPAVLPTRGAARKLGTNAISFAIPAGDEPPFVMDMATSAVAVGKLELARRKSEPIPLGWAVDSQGRDTTDPNDYWAGGALVPLGSTPELSSHKGFALGMLVDILSGVLTGAGFGAVMSREKRPVGHFVGASPRRRIPTRVGVQGDDGRDGPRHEVYTSGRPEPTRANPGSAGARDPSGASEQRHPPSRGGGGGAPSLRPGVRHRVPPAPQLISSEGHRGGVLPPLP